MKTLPGFALCVALLLSVTVAVGSEQHVKMTDLPPAVQKTVREVSQGATIRGFAKEVEHGKTEYEVEMTVNGHGKDVSMDSNGAVLEVEEEVKLDDIPAVAKSAIEKSAAGGTVLKVESVTQGGTLKTYEAVVQRGGKKSEVRVDPQGNPAPED